MSIESRFEHCCRVLVVRGPFAGVTGTARESDARHRLLVDLEVLGASLTVEMDADWLTELGC
jgi:transcription antitermination factor NusG